MKLAALAWLAAILAASSVHATPVATEEAIARSLQAPKGTMFRRAATHGDVVCGEIGSHERFRPFYAYPRGGVWGGHAASDGRGLRAGLQCFDAERAGRKAPACKGYDFHFYFAYDHFCR